MFENFKEKLQQKIDEFDWMQDEDKVKAKKKALQTQSHIGFPDVLSDQRELENMYSNVIQNSFYQFFGTCQFCSFRASKFRNMIFKLTVCFSLISRTETVCCGTCYKQITSINTS